MNLNAKLALVCFALLAGCRAEPAINPYALEPALPMLIEYERYAGNDPALTPSEQAQAVDRSRALRRVLREAMTER